MALDAPEGSILRGFRIGMLLAAMAFFIAIAPAAYGQDLSLKVETKTTATVVHNKQSFSVDTLVRNTSNMQQILQTYQCSYGDWNWKTDNSVVHVQARSTPICKKNPLVYIKLKPGGAYERALSIFISIPNGKTIPQSVTFRIGCKPRTGYNSSTESPPYIWSEPVTIKVEE